MIAAALIAFAATTACGAERAAAGAASADSAPGAASADSDSGGPAVEGARIGRIDVRTREIFEPVPAGRLRPLYELVNRFHIRTRAHTVRQLLLFETGEPWSDERAKETERQLRALSYLFPEPIVSRSSGDSTIVTVTTSDLWSTTFDFNLEKVDGAYYGAVALTERNLFGFGKGLSLVYREDQDGITRALTLDDPNVLGTRVRFSYGASHGANGSVDQVGVGLPFYAEDAPAAFGFSWRRAASLARLYSLGEEVARVDVGDRYAEAYFGRGRRDGGRVTRALAIFQAIDRKLGETEVVEPNPPAEFLGGEEASRIRRVSVEGRLWWPHFVVRRNVDRLVRPEDFDLGRTVAMRFGVAPEFMGSSENEGFGRIELGAGIETRAGFGRLDTSVQSRIRQDEWIETLAQANARWTTQHLSNGTLVLAARGVRGVDMERDFQVELGGLNGLRAYPVHALAGHRTLRFNAEERWLLTERLWNFLAMGVVGFGDAGRAWGPGAEGTAWLVAAGTGLRLSLPRWAPHQVLRIDVAWPVHPGDDAARDPVLSFGSSQAF